MLLKIMSRLRIDTMFFEQRSVKSEQQNHVFAKISFHAVTLSQMCFRPAKKHKKAILQGSQL